MIPMADTIWRNECKNQWTNDNETNDYFLVCHPQYKPAVDSYNKKEQNVRQRQKLISIIDYDVCMTFY